MAVNLRKKYYGKKEISKKNRPYKYQLDYIHNGKRIRETIKNVKFLPSDTREQRKEKERVINKIKNDLEIDLANQSTGLISRQLKKASFILYFQKLTDTKNPNTKTVWENTLIHILKFHGKQLKFEDITENWIESFSKYLLKNLSQNSARVYLQKINTALNMAVRQKIILENPYRFLNKPKKEEIEMVYLVREDIQEIINTDFFDNEVKNAFLFGCYTGLRFSDICRLKWSNIKNNQIQLTQTKTKGLVYIPLNMNAISILQKQKNNKDLVFKLSKHNSSVNRTLKKLIKKTSINKNVSFHSSRHTFATLLISSGVNVYTVSKLLGHKDIESTLIYAKVINEEKEKAVNSMPNFNL
ncbi:tyrosine-type recombinase/integrase [Tenacibaculum mesophilum]|uniref:tyrosine-type recombinase/integrase n=1 Tax=Tenacibaculum mesophilum TaxID=104268 RepID=UPI002493AF02|nr:site-specific integrase [Tenacibaculum mesophilum]